VIILDAEKQSVHHNLFSHDSHIFNDTDKVLFTSWISTKILYLMFTKAAFTIQH